jgi:hypothetical protein
LERSNNEQKTVVLITTEPTLVELFAWLGEGVRWIVVASVEALRARPYPVDLILWQGDSDGQCVPSELFSYQVPVVALVAQGWGALQRFGEGCLTPSRCRITGWLSPSMSKKCSCYFGVG